MARTIDRKCRACGEVIRIDRYNVQGVIAYKKAFYHTQCFVKHATKLSQSNRANASEWAEALENMEDYVQKTQKSLGTCKASDKLNDWILDHYHITTTASFSTFWRAVKKLELGEYKGKSCQRIPTNLLYEAWIWAQPNLDKIARNNKVINKHIEGEARLNYDLSIIVNKYTVFLKWKDKQKAAAAAAVVQESQRPKINYSNLEKQALESKKDTDSLDDISDLLDELF
jgi:hypothetical protein